MNCLIIDDMYPSIIEKLEGAGVVVDYQPDYTREDLLKNIAKYEGLVVRSKTRINKEVFNVAKNLKYIARAGAGVDNIDEEYMKKMGVTLFNAPEGNRDAVGEQALGMLLALMNNLHWGDREVRGYKWDREGNRGVELNGKTVGIIGYGFMGSAFGQRAKAMGCKVLAYDKYKTNFSDEFVQEATMEQLQEEADIISFHFPLTVETENFADYNFFTKFKKPLWLLNTARGKSLVLKDLLTCLEEGRIIKAGLDVIENEKLDKLTGTQRDTFDRLITEHRVLLTPHVAGWSVESYQKISDVLGDKIVSFLTSNNK